MLGPGVGKSMQVNPLRTVSPFTVALWVSWMKAPLAFKARCFWVRLSGSGLKSWGTKSRVQAFCYSRRSSRLWVFSWLWLARPGLGLWWDCVSASPIHFTFLICPMCRIHSARVFFPPRGNRSVCSYRFSVSLRGREFRILLHCCLEPQP